MGQPACLTSAASSLSMLVWVDFGSGCCFLSDSPSQVPTQVSPISVNDTAIQLDIPSQTRRYYSWSFFFHQPHPISLPSWHLKRFLNLALSVHCHIHPMSLLEAALHTFPVLQVSCGLLSVLTCRTYPLSQMSFYSLSPTILQRPSPLLS